MAEKVSFFLSYICGFTARLTFLTILPEVISSAFGQYHQTDYLNPGDGTQHSNLFISHCESYYHQTQSI